METYDGTLYFSDVWFRDRGVRAVVEEAEEAAKAGYRGIKLKLGRGWKWMEPEPGFRRDVEVVHAVRKAVGPGMRILVDINNGYQKEPERAWRLLAGDGRGQPVLARGTIPGTSCPCTPGFAPK